MIILTKTQISSLIEFIESKLEVGSCDHSLKLAIEWANRENYDNDNLVDILEENGGYCDCEVVMNLSGEQDLILENEEKIIDYNNLWRIPNDYKISDTKKRYSKVLISTEKCGHNCYAGNNEILIPAPFGLKPKKRVRSSVNYFVGVVSGLPNEYGFVSNREQITAREFAKLIRDSRIKGIERFTEREADFYLSRIENLLVDTPVGTHFTEKNGLTKEYELLRIHKIIIGN